MEQYNYKSRFAWKVVNPCGILFCVIKYENDMFRPFYGEREGLH